MKYSQSKLKLTSSKIAVILLSSIMLSGCFPTIGNGSGNPKKDGEFKAGTVVANFPPIPLYPKAKVIESYGSKESYGASFEIDEPLTKVFEYYNDSFSKLGWDATTHKKTNTNIVYDVKNDKYTGQVIINTAADGKTTAILMALTRR